MSLVFILFFVSFSSIENRNPYLYISLVIGGLLISIYFIYNFIFIKQNSNMLIVDSVVTMSLIILLLFSIISFKNK